MRFNNNNIYSLLALSPFYSTSFLMSCSLLGLALNVNRLNSP